MSEQVTSPPSIPAPHTADKKLIRFLTRPVILEESGPPRSVVHMLAVCGLMMAGFLVWATITELRETAATRGQITPSGSVHSVQHLEGGIVKEILVADGELVEEGQPLLRLEPTPATAELEQLRAREAALALKAERLRAFVLGYEPDFSAGITQPGLVADQRMILGVQQEARTSQHKVLLARIEQRQAELAAVREQRANLKQQISIMEQQLAVRRPLARKGLVSRIDLLETERAYTKSVGELNAAIGNEARVREALNEARASILELDARLDNEALDEMGAVTAELAQVREQLAKLQDRVTRLEIRAPSRGIVKGLAVRTLGAVIAPGATVMEIVPLEDEMVAEVLIEPRDIGHLQAGQEAWVKITTYDVSRFGAVPGRLRHISASTFQSEDGRLFYRGTIALDRSYVGAEPGRYPVLPGMEVEADINTGSKSLLRYLLKPVFRSLDGAFRER